MFKAFGRSESCQQRHKKPKRKKTNKNVGKEKDLLSPSPPFPPIHYSVTCYKKKTKLPKNSLVLLVSTTKGPIAAKIIPISEPVVVD